ncbi:trypsin-like peptidase domain-containing protein [Anabaena sp. AL09]|uniref:trypsin-like peptidase domain-containing protein n=1 Tax=Anabaena sp. AL09 TaxID=1710891 RepID=UPI0007FF7B14|nr:trypsin-like peptidase domain-containing protein [Anabaena sp. AL09]OBQ03801.1 MAG: hypothetical protein AN490_17190 [Anabaena sp. AL09]
MVDATRKELHKNHIARIYNPFDDVKGAGLLIYDKYIITSAHVVADALNIAHSTPEKPSDLVNVDFLFPAEKNKPKFEAKVIAWKPRSDIYQHGEDIAILELQGNLPKSDISFPLSLEVSYQHQFSVLGFPIGHDEGVFAEGKLVDTNGSGLVQMDVENQSKFSIESGFSGAPVWVEKLASFVGIVVSSELDPDGQPYAGVRRNVKVGYMIPAKIIIESWSFLSLIQALTANLDTSINSAIQTAYKSCGLVNSPQTTVEGIVKDLYDWDKRNLDSNEKFNHNDNTAQFIKYLITNSQIPQTKLEKWGSDNIENFDNLIKNVNQQYQNTDTKQESYILIKIEPLTTKSRSKIPKFKISGGVIPNIQNYIEHQTGFESIKFSDSPDDSFTLKEIEKNLFLSLFQKIPCKLEKDKKFVFFLPPQYLNHPVETWEIDDFGDRIPVRQRYPVMVRDVTRLNTNYLNVKQSNWIDKWQQLENITCNDFQKLHEYNETRFSVLMKQAIGVILNIFDENKKNDADKIIKIFSSLKSNVVPIAICHRDKITLEQQEYEIRANNELNCYIHTLPNHVLEQYEKFLLNDNDNQYLFVNNVFIIYENPHILPFKAEAIIIN